MKSLDVFTEGQFLYMEDWLERRRYGTLAEWARDAGYLPAEYEYGHPEPFATDTGAGWVDTNGDGVNLWAELWDTIHGKDTGTAADEIERLRSLVTAWADACDADNEMWKTDPSIADRAVTFAAMRNATLELRKAVGR